MKHYRHGKRIFAWKILLVACSIKALVVSENRNYKEFAISTNTSKGICSEILLSMPRIYCQFPLSNIKLLETGLFTKNAVHDQVLLFY